LHISDPALPHPIILFLIVATLGSPFTASAQTTGELSGVAYDQTGAVLAGVRILVRGPKTAGATTTADGEFTFAALPEGDYEVSAELAGFEPTRRTVRVRAAERVELSLTLALATVAETIVTSAKVGERGAQSVPMAISALSDGELDRLGITTVDQAAPLAPSVTFTQNSNFGQLSIRGIGTNAVYAGADPSSVMYLDGVYLARPAMAFVEFLDLDRVEVLRGPQGTLYGRNAVGGAMNLISKPPTNEFQGSARFTTGNLGALQVSAAAGGPLKRDRVMGRVAFVRTVRDGYVHDLEQPDQRLGGDNVTGARGQVRVVFDRRTNLLLSSDISDQRGTPLTFNKVLSPKPGFTFDSPSDLHEVRTSIEAWQRLRQYGAAARLESALTPTMTLVSLTAWRTLDYAFSLDSDITELDISTFDQHESQRQFSEELTVSQQTGRLTWVAGLFLFDETDDQSLVSPQQPAGVEIRLLPRIDAASRAVFGQSTIRVTSQLSATLGLRYTHERKTIDNAGGLYSLDAAGTPVSGTNYSYADSTTHSAWTPKFGLEMKLAGDALAYVSATRGFKSGGFNLSSQEPGLGFAPEWAWSYEAGLKRALLDGRSRLAISAFTTDYTNLQVQTPIRPGVYDIRNAATARIHGLEVENTTRLGRGLEVGGHLTWLDAAYDHYIAVAVGGATGDVSGKRLNNAPEWAGRVWVDWSRDIGRSGRLSIAVDATAQSTVFFTPFNDDIQRQGPYGLLGGRIEYGPGHRRWSVAAYSRNLTSTGYIMATFGTAPTAFGGRPAAPRQWAIDLTLRR
jgi:iron complex outermembrane receptor protein